MEIADGFFIVSILNSGAPDKIDEARAGSSKIDSLSIETPESDSSPESSEEM